MPLRERTWRLYRVLAARYPLVRRILAPLRWYYHFNYLSYTMFRLRGGSYRDWYAKVLDSFARSAEPPPLEGLEQRMGIFQLDYLSAHGLKPDHSLLDFGCGNLRAGVYFIEYLNPGRYVGADISAGRLEQGRSRIAALGLEVKRPELVHLRGMSLDEIGPRSFDFIWAQGVLAHMPLHDIDALFQNIRRLIVRESVFFVNYADGGGASFKASMKDFYYATGLMEEICARYELKCERMADWRHAWPHPLRERDKMLRVTIAEESRT